MLKLHVGQRVTYISWIIINIRATAHLPPPPLTQQQSTDDKLRLMLGKERGRLAVAQILILIPFHFLPSLAYERSPPLYTPPPPSVHLLPSFLLGFVSVGICDMLSSYLHN